MRVVRTQNTELLKSLATLADGSVAVGFFPEDKYVDGTPVAEIASIHEYGSVINKEAGEQTVYRSIGKDGEFKKGGKFVKKAKSNFASTHNVPAHQIRIPCRSFMRTTIHEKEQSWVDQCAKYILEGKSVAKTMSAMGSIIGGDVAKKIHAIAAAGGNAPSTIRRKGFDTPLIHTGNMLRSVSFKINGGNVTKVRAA